jgi:hypothetical protein
VTVSITPQPTAEEAAAIVAAHEALWPKPLVAAGDERTTPPWRFSGRWWTPPLPLRRARP